MEELYSLLLIIGHVIADEGEGEMPLVCGCSFSLFSDSEMFFSKLQIQIFFFFLNERNLNRQKKLLAKKACFGVGVSDFLKQCQHDT